MTNNQQLQICIIHTHTHRALKNSIFKNDPFDSEKVQELVYLGTSIFHPSVTGLNYMI